MHFLAQGSEITVKNAWEFLVLKRFLCICCFASRNFAKTMHRKFPKSRLACAFAKSGAGTPRKKAPLSAVVPLRRFPKKYIFSKYCQSRNIVLECACTEKMRSCARGNRENFSKGGTIIDNKTLRRFKIYR